MARKLRTGSLLLATTVAALAVPQFAAAARRPVGQKVLFSNDLFQLAPVAAGDAAGARGSGSRPGATGGPRHLRRRVHAADDCAAAQSVPRDDNLHEIDAATLCLLNRERVRRHLRRLRENRRLSEASAGHSRDMAQRNYFDHTAPGGLTMVRRIMRVDYVQPNQGWMLGENIAWGTGALATPAGVVRMWMHSPGHRANILNGSFREIGIGVAVGVPVSVDAAAGGATYTTDFGRRS